MRKHLLTTAAAIAFVAGGTAIASAECEIVNSELEQRVAADPDSRAGYSAPVMRDIRELRNAAHTLEAYGKDDACQEVADAINELIENPQDVTRTSSSGDTQPMWNDQRPAYTYEATKPVSEVAGRIRAYELIGADLRGTNNETVGEISDIVLDTSGAPAYVLIAHGGFLGLGEEESAVPFDMLQVSKDGEVFYVALSEKQVENAPRFERGSFDWFEDEAWRQENDKYFSEGMAGQNQ